MTSCDQARRNDQIATDADGLLSIRGSFFDVTVEEVTEEVPGVRSIKLGVPKSIGRFFTYQPGQYLTFRLPHPCGELYRSYSLSSSPSAAARPTVTVKRIPGGRASNWINDEVVPGTRLSTTLPRGAFTLSNGSRPAVFLAAGSGITPIVPMMESAMVESSCPIRLLYVARSRDEAIFLRRIEALTRQYSQRIRFDLHLTERAGRPTHNMIADQLRDATGVKFYLCGPVGFMTTALEVLSDLGVPSEDVAREYFSAPDLEESKHELHRGWVDVIVRLDGRDKTLSIARGKTILQGAMEEGLLPPSGCKAGACGACRARLISGSVDGRPFSGLTSEEISAGYILTCQARSIADAVIDYDA